MSQALRVAGKGLSKQKDKSGQKMSEYEKSSFSRVSTCKLNPHENVDTCGSTEDKSECRILSCMAKIGNREL